MAFRNDISVDWAVSPRIIEVAAPSTEVLVQDLVDTCRTLESELGALDDDFLIYAEGKTTCGSIIVGITLLLNNAKIKFEARPPGAWVVCRVTGGNIWALDAAGNSMDPREPSAYTNTDIELSTSAALVAGGDTTVQQVREGNMRRTYVAATVPDLVRKVAVGKLDHVVVEYKDDADPDWTVPKLTQTLYAWYATLGDDTPYLIGEDG